MSLGLTEKKERLAAISLMIDKERVLEKIGFFDCVRIAADTEYLGRLKLAFGRAGVKHMRQTLYHGLLRSGSLTTADGSGMKWKATSGANIMRSQSGDRATYLNAARAWHETLKHDTGSGTVYIAFPVEERRFSAPCAITVNASPMVVKPYVSNTGIEEKVQHNA